jgi:DNA polymerase-1
VLVDVAERDALKKRIETRIAETSAKVSDLVGEKFNCNSPKQVSELLYEKMRLPVMFGKNDKPTSDEEAIKKLYQRYPDEPILKLILAYRKDTKLVSTYLDIKLDENNRMHTSYNPSGTGTYRISSSKSLDGSGMNLQNIPKGKRAGIENIRYLFLADPGKTIIKGDLVQAEAMDVAWILTRYGDNTLYDKYTSGTKFDVHRWAAAPIFSVDESNVNKWQREVGKIANHSGNYCAGPRVIQSTATKWDVEGVDYALAKRIIDLRRAQLPGLERWWAGVERQVRSTRTLTTCFGRRRQFFNRVESVVADAVAFEPQSTVGDTCNLIFLRLHQMGFEMLLQVHDEVVFQVPDSQVSEGVAALRKAADIDLNISDSVALLRIPIEICVGKNWRDCEEVK